jgi:hypothetical protein
MLLYAFKKSFLQKNIIPQCEENKVSMNSSTLHFKIGIS